MTIKSFSILLVGYRLTDTIASLRFCDHLFRKLNISRKILVANRPEILEYLSRIDIGWELVLGSNKLAEFSGWQEGIYHLAKTGQKSNAIIFANDTISTHRYFTASMRIAFIKALIAIDGKSIVGFTDQATGDFRVANLALKFWVSTYCFALTSSALDILKNCVFDGNLVSHCVPGGADEIRFFAEISDDLKLHLRQWLFHQGWYDAESLSIENAPRFEYKAKCIIAEKLLSAQCAQRGIEFCDPFIKYRFWRQLDKSQRKIKRVMTDYRLSPRIKLG